MWFLCGLRVQWLMVAGMLTMGFWLIMVGIFEFPHGQEVYAQQYNNKEIQAFAKAQIKITKIQTAFKNKEGGRKIVDLTTPVGELPQEIQQHTIQAIEAEGLTVETYNKILETYKTNEIFRSKVVRAIVNLYP